MELRDTEVGHEAAQNWETKLLPIIGDALLKRRHCAWRGYDASWHLDQINLKVLHRRS
jgi:hypothetical protein